MELGVMFLTTLWSVCWPKCGNIGTRKSTVPVYGISFLPVSIRLAVTALLCSQFRTSFAGVNCDAFDIECHRGTCVEVTSPLTSSVVLLNGTKEATCICDSHWSGRSCNIYTCGGRTLLTNASGMVSDGTGNYTTDNKCTWLIEYSSENLPVRLKFDEFVTECSWDHLYIFDGSSVYDPLIGVFSGIIMPLGSIDITTIPELTAFSGSAYLYFYSDAAVNMSGFSLKYRYLTCPENCSSNGECLANGTCICHAGWTGSGCGQPTCPNNCSFPNGFCESNKSCVCSPQFRGYDCSIPISEGFWAEVQLSFDSPTGFSVASYGAVVLRDQLWTFCGYSFTETGDCSQVAWFDFSQNMWTHVDVEKSVTPASRYGHSTVIYQGDVYIYGGVSNGVILNELWLFNMTSLSWSLITPMYGTPLEAVGHTAHVIDDVMYVFFGYHPQCGYLNAVQLYDFVSGEWSEANTTGAEVKGSYGHTSVYDELTGVILVHGGYHSVSASTYLLTDALYELSTNTSAWRVLMPSHQSRYLHSAALLGRLMLIYGGNTHNDTSAGRATKCYSNNFMAYDLECHSWYTLDDPKVQRNIARFGHSAVLHDDKMYVYGGFNGIVLNDMFVYEPAMCSGYVTRDDCLTSRDGVRCVWANDKFCTTPDSAQRRLDNKNIETIQPIECATVTDVRADCDKERYRTCSGCMVSVLSCEWCSGQCQYADSCNSAQKATTAGECWSHFELDSLQCANLHNCHACSRDNQCQWNDREHKCEAVTGMALTSDTDVSCVPSCSEHASCENCTMSACMWCSSGPPHCVESNSYVASFPYGQCREWTTLTSKCPATRCKDLLTCSTCHDNPSCGWCDDASNTGLGTCHDGGRVGPRASTADVTSTRTGNMSEICPTQRWYFTSCPLCQCNGHSQCAVNSSQCLNCEHMTTGPQCERCIDGYWGHPISGGNCSECQCGDQADLCHQETGVCFCNTRGVIGDHCTECDTAHKYYGDPTVSTCYYELTVDYIFSFNLSYEENKYITQMNFMNTPPKELDVDFKINCTGNATINITYTTAFEPEEKLLVADIPCTVYIDVFSEGRFHFGSDYNTTFFVYLYDFRTPFFVQLYFSQNDQLDLLKFFITFFSCFFSLLLIAFVVWKLKQKYDTYRRGQRHIQEMAAMASRPFAACLINVDSDKSADMVPVSLTRTDIRASSRRKVIDKYTPVGCEPLSGHKSAIVTVILRLPTGDDEYAPPDQCGIAIGSALVAYGSHARRLSHDHGSKSERSSRRRKHIDRSNCTPTPTSPPPAGNTPSEIPTVRISRNATDHDSASGHVEAVARIRRSLRGVVTDASENV